MPKDPKGRKRPADVIGNAVLLIKIATGEVEEQPEKPAAVALGRLGGRKRGLGRTSALSEAYRKAIGKCGAAARWARKEAA